MFLSEEGSLPPLDSKALVINVFVCRVLKLSLYLLRVSAWRSSKARDTYGPIVELVKKQQEQARKSGIPANYPGAPLTITNKQGFSFSSLDIL